MEFPSRDLNNLTPVVKRGCEEFLKRCQKQGLKVIVTETYRSAEYQALLFAKGRSTKGSIVTNLSGRKGQESPHQFRIAFDICQNIRGQEYPARLPISKSNVCFWQICGKIWRDMGGTWGGDWKSFVDNPHFEFTDNKGYTPFRNGYIFPLNQLMPWEKK